VQTVEPTQVPTVDPTEEPSVNLPFFDALVLPPPTLMMMTTRTILQHLVIWTR
jgi:hypothetical protein